MKITKYPQSCLLIKKNETTLLIDPGEPFSQEFDIEDLGEIQAVLFTHKHPDHVSRSSVEYFLEHAVTMYGNESVVEMLGEEVELVEDGDEFSVGVITINAYELPHCLMPDGSEGPQNTGYVIDGNLFHPGDGLEIEGVEVSTVAAPIAGPDVSPKDAFQLAKSVGAKRVIPIHYDTFIADPHVIAEFSDMFDMGLEFLILDHGESVEL